MALPSHFPSLTADDWLDPMKTAMTPLIGAYWDAAGQVTREKLGLDPEAWQVTDPHLKEKIEQATLSFCQETNATTSMQLNDALTTLRQELVAGVVEQGDSLVELTKRVQKVFDRASKYRAGMIAQTETARAVHAASLESARTSGVVAGKRWLLSANACEEICQPIGAKYPDGIPLDDPFDTVGNNEHYRTVVHCPAHPHCRCSMTYVLTEEYEAILRTVGPPNGSIEPGPLGPEPKEREVAEPEPEPKRDRTPIGRAVAYASARGLDVEPAASSLFVARHGEVKTAKILASYDDILKKLLINERHPYWKDRKSQAEYMKRRHADGYYSSSEPEHIVWHETAHGLQHKQLGDDEYNLVKRYRFKSEQQASIRGGVGKYASTKPVEFVAEVYAGIVAGKTYPDDVMGLYSKLKGPTP